MSLGFIFPGQGSQEVGMLGELIAQEASVRECFGEAGDVLGLDLATLVDQGPEEQLNRTEFTQPALLTASVALWRVWQARGGPLPAIVAGHSLGEYSALVCAGALAFADAVKLVNLRGSLMQASVPPGEGAMAAILGLEDVQVVDCCADASSVGVVSAANFNAPGQVVIAGATDAVEAAIERCQDAGARRALKLAVSVPSHCALMLPAAQEFAEHLAATPVAMPTVPVIHNVDAAISADTDGIRNRLVSQLSEPVRWTACASAMADQGVRSFIECGPGKVLAGLQKRIDKGISTYSIATPETLTATFTELGSG